MHFVFIIGFINTIIIYQDYIVLNYTFRNANKKPLFERLSISNNGISIIFLCFLLAYVLIYLFHTIYQYKLELQHIYLQMNNLYVY